MTAHTPPARRRTERPPLRHSALVLLISLSVTGAAWLGAVYVTPTAYQVPMAWGAGAAALLLCAAAVVAAHGIESSRLLRGEIDRMAQDAHRLAHETVPGLVERLRDGASPETALAGTPDHDSDSCRTLLRIVAEEIGRGESSRAAAMSACANAAGRMQAQTTSMLADLREMEHRHTDEEVLGDLLHLDHRTAQAGRIADSIAVLTGARSGRRWAKPIVMESILRGAMGRIGGYQRIRLHSASNLAIAGHAAEGVMHALAELLDNACNFSPPTAEVHVYVEEVPAGAIITIEDSGLVMSEVALRRAERAVSAEPLDLTNLSGTRLGLAVVGCLARKHGLSVSFRPSARGGTGALVMIPQELITRPQRATAPPVPQAQPAAVPAPRRAVADGPAAQPEPAAPAPAVAAPEPAAPAPAGPENPSGPPATPDHAPAAAGSDGPPEFGESGLPKRRRGRTLASAHSSGPAPQPAAKPGPAHSPAESAARFGAFRRAVQGQAPDGPTTESSSSRPEDDTR